MRLTPPHQCTHFHNMQEGLISAMDCLNAIWIIHGSNCPFRHILCSHEPVLQEMEGIVMPPYEGLVTLNFSADGNFLAAFSVPVIATSEISPSSASQGTLRVWSLTASWRQTMFLQRIAITVPAHVHRAIVIDSRHVVAHHHQVTAGTEISMLSLCISTLCRSGVVWTVFSHE